MDLALKQARGASHWQEDAVFLQASRAAFSSCRERLRKNDEIKPMIVPIADGRANVDTGGMIEDELLEISERNRQLGVNTIVIDTEVSRTRSWI